MGQAPKEQQTISKSPTTIRPFPINSLPTSNHSHHDVQGRQSIIASRHTILLLCMAANICSYTMRTSLNLTIVTMVPEEQNKTDLNTCRSGYSNGETQVDTSGHNHSLAHSYEWKSPLHEEKKWDGGEFDWSESLQGTILGAFYYGYIFSMVVAGQLADLLGTKRLIGGAILVCGLCTLAIPVSAYLHPYALVAVRVLTGIAQGVVTPALYTILPQWTPKSEIGLAFGLVQASGQLGAVITMPICGFLSEYGFAGGWPSVFYVFGVLALLFLVPWAYFVYDSPAAHPRTSELERVYIRSNLSISAANNSDGKKRKKIPVPWRAILTSPRVWAISLTRFCTAWGNLFLMSKLPTYLKSILHMPITYNGYVNASIYVAQAGSNLFFGYVSDFVERKHFFSRNISRKLFQSLALLGGAFFLAIIPLAGCSVIAIIILLNLSMLTIGLIAGGENLICVDVAPDFSGLVYGVTNAIASLPGFLAPLFVGVMLDSSNSNPMQQWNILFWIGAAIYVVGAFVFIFGVSANPTKWGLASPNVHASVEESKSDYDKSSSTNQVNIDINSNGWETQRDKHCM